MVKKSIAKTRELARRHSDSKRPAGRDLTEQFNMEADDCDDELSRLGQESEMRYVGGNVGLQTSAQLQVLPGSFAETKPEWMIYLDHRFGNQGDMMEKTFGHLDARMSHLENNLVAATRRTALRLEGLEAAFGQKLVMQ